MDISNLLQGAVGQQLIGGAAKQLGINDNQAQSAIATAVPFLLSALNKNAQNGGASAINNALERDHDGGILDNLSGFLSGGDTTDGMGILKHVLGNNQPQVAQAIGKSSGLDMGKASQLLAVVAPIIMGYLGKQKREQGLGADGISGLLGNLVNGAAQNNQREMSTIERLLDANGDGSIMDEAMDLGGKLLGGLFKK